MILKKQQVINVAITNLLILILLSCGCSEQKQTSENKRPEIKKEIVEEKEPEKIVYKDEIYGDTEMFSQPRLQFAWQAPMEKEQTVWSTFLDGSDLRRVVDPELFFKIDGIIRHKPVRSPDNRYLAVSLDTSDVMGSVKVLYDLKEKTVKELGGGAFIPRFQWTADGRYLYYYNDDNLWKYDVKLKKNFVAPMIYSRGLYIINNDRFVALHSGGYSVHSSDGKEVVQKEIKGGSVSSFAQAVSKDGSLVYCLIDGNKKPFDIIFKLNNPDDVIYKSFDMNILRSVFGPENKKLYFSQGIVEYLDLETKEILEVFGLPERPIMFLTIFNVK